MKRVAIFLAALMLFILSGFGSQSALASLSWADAHRSYPNAFGGNASYVTHFFESGQESCYSAGLACRFEVVWYWWDGSAANNDWITYHATELDYQYGHGAYNCCDWPNLGHGYPGSDTHGNSTYNGDGQIHCDNLMTALVSAVDSGNNYLSHQQTAWINAPC